MSFVSDFSVKQGRYWSKAFTMGIYNTKLDSAEIEKYIRHISMPGFGMKGQEKLKSSRVLVVGAGGLASPLLSYLTAAGIGKIGIIDFDVVELSNLQRQVLYNTDDIGISKADRAEEKLKRLNPGVRIETYDTKLSKENAAELIDEFDIIADGSDNFDTRYLVNDTCVALGKPDVYGSVSRFSGQVSVFNYKYEDGTYGPNYRDIYPVPPSPETIPDCNTSGVLGALTGVIGSMQACEVIKVLTGIGEPLAGRMFTFDALKFESRIFNFNKSARNAGSLTIDSTGKINENFKECDDSCEAQTDMKIDTEAKEKTVWELKDMFDKGGKFQLIDVREAYEYDAGNLGGENIPFGELEESKDRISKDTPVIVYCRNGGRSIEASNLLRSKFGLNEVYSLKGGILAYSDEIV